jgi:hypothetical protein
MIFHDVVLGFRSERAFTNETHWLDRWNDSVTFAIVDDRIFVASLLKLTRYKDNTVQFRSIIYLWDNDLT